MIKEHKDPDAENIQTQPDRHDEPLIASCNAATASRAEQVRAERAKAAAVSQQAADKKVEAEKAATEIAAGRATANSESPVPFSGQFDHGTDAERHFVNLLPHVSKCVNTTLADNGHEELHISEAEIVANFLSEDGYGILQQAVTDDIDGFQFLSIENFVGELEVVRDWLHPGVLEYGKHPENLAQQIEEARAAGNVELVKSLKYVTLELGLYANAGVYAQRKAMAAEAIARAGGDFTKLPVRGQLFWTTLFFKLEPNHAMEYLQAEGIHAYQGGMAAPSGETTPADAQDQARQRHSDVQTLEKHGLRPATLRRVARPTLPSEGQGNIPVRVTSSAPLADLTLEYSTDGGRTFRAATFQATNDSSAERVLMWDSAADILDRQEIVVRISLGERQAANSESAVVNNNQIAPIQDAAS